MTEFGFHTTGEEASLALAEQIKGKTVLITGVTPGGLGLETARVVALRAPKLLILAGRSQSKLQQASDVIEKAAPGTPVKHLVVDLQSLSSVRHAAASVLAWPDVPAIDVLINNAGIMAVPFALTPDGIESTFATNHVAHFLLTQLLLPKLLAAVSPRIVNLSSAGYRRGGVRFSDWNFGGGEDYDKWAAYAQSKSANILYSRALAERLGGRGVTAFAVHPGTIWTNLGGHVVGDLKKMGFVDEEGNKVDGPVVQWKTLQEGVSNSIVGAFDPSIAAHNGAYLVDCKVADTPEEWMQDPSGPAKLWALSEKLVGEEFPVEK